MRFLGLFVLLFVVMCYGVFGTNSLQQNSPFSWSNWKNDEVSSGRVPNTFGELQYSSNFPPDASTSSKPYGSTLQALTIDIDSDGVNEIITTSSNYVNVLKVNDVQQIDAVTQLLLPYSIILQPSLYNGSNGYPGVLVVTKNMTYALEWNVTSNSLFIKNSLNLLPFGNAFTGARCVSLFVSEDTCVFLTSNAKIIKYSPRSNTVSNFTATGYSPYSYTNPPAIADQNRDNIYEIAWAYNFFGTSTGYVVFDFDGNHHFHGCVGGNSNNGGGCVNTHIGTGYSNIAFVFGQYCQNIFWWINCQFDGYLVLVTDESTSDSGFGLGVFEIQSNGVYLRSMVVSPTPGSAPATAYTSAAFGEFTGAVKEVCAIPQGSASTLPTRCFNLETGAITQTMSKGKIKQPTVHSIASGDYNSDGYDEIVTDTQIISPHLNTSTNWTTVQAGNIILSDVTTDGIGEIVTTTTGNVAVSFSTVTTAGTSSNHSIVLSGLDLFRNFQNPICKGSNVVFTAYDCRFYPSDKCQYTNSFNSFEEYLYTDCGSGSTLLYTAGLPVHASPSVSCVFNETGVHLVRVFVTDTGLGTHPLVNPSWNIQIIVGNVTDCNLFPYIPNLVTGSTPSSGQISDVRDLVTGGGSWSLTIAAFIIILLLAFGSIYMLWIHYGIHDPQIVGYGASFIVLVGWIFLCIYNIIGWWTLVVAILISAAVVSLKFLQSSNPTVK